MGKVLRSIAMKKKSARRHSWSLFKLILYQQPEPFAMNIDDF